MQYTALYREQHAAKRASPRVAAELAALETQLCAADIIRYREHAAALAAAMASRGSGGGGDAAGKVVSQALSLCVCVCVCVCVCARAGV